MLYVFIHLCGHGALLHARHAWAPLAPHWAHRHPCALLDWNPSAWGRQTTKYTTKYVIAIVMRVVKENDISLSWAGQGPGQGGFLEEMSLNKESTARLRDWRQAMWPKAPEKDRGIVGSREMAVAYRTVTNSVFSQSWWVELRCDLRLVHQTGWSVENRLERGSVNVWRPVGRLLWSYLPEKKKRIWGPMYPTYIWAGEKPTVGYIGEDTGKKTHANITTSGSGMSFYLLHLPEGYEI